MCIHSKTSMLPDLEKETRFEELICSCLCDPVGQKWNFSAKTSFWATTVQSSRTHSAHCYDWKSITHLTKLNVWSRVVLVGDHKSINFVNELRCWCQKLKMLIWGGGGGGGGLGFHFYSTRSQFIIMEVESESALHPGLASIGKNWKNGCKILASKQHIQNFAVAQQREFSVEKHTITRDIDHLTDHAVTECKDGKWQVLLKCLSLIKTEAFKLKCSDGKLVKGQWDEKQNTINPEPPTHPHPHSTPPHPTPSRPHAKNTNIDKRKRSSTGQYVSKYLWLSWGKQPSKNQ